jgi:hypothetical protein
MKKPDLLDLLFVAVFIGISLLGLGFAVGILLLDFVK